MPTPEPGQQAMRADDPGRLANERGAALEWIRLALQTWDAQRRRDFDDVAELVDAVRAALERPGAMLPVYRAQVEREVREQIANEFDDSDLHKVIADDDEYSPIHAPGCPGCRAALIARDEG